jgi:hypothetical protein
MLYRHTAPLGVIREQAAFRGHWQESRTGSPQSILLRNFESSLKREVKLGFGGAHN